ncbi:MAG: NAD(P)H-hydrate dehydratase [Hungatella sp.]
MRYLVSGSRMKEMDTYAIQTIGIPSMVLMERAALAVAEETQKIAKKTDRIWAVCGIGNNGADGIAAARILTLRGYRVTILLVGNADHGTPEYHAQAEIAEKLEIPMVEFCDFIPGTADVILDALFGVGLSGAIVGEYRTAIELLQKQTSASVIAVDLPSGIHSNTGQVMGIAWQADRTVTFGYEKLGTVLYPGRSYAGKVVVADIGLPGREFATAGDEAYTYELCDCKRMPDRSAEAHKGSFGKVLVVAGSEVMSGAAYLSALAAYRMGAGLVKILTVEANRSILLQQLPEVLLETYKPQMILEDPEEFHRLVAQECDWASVIVLGPGLSTKPYVETLVQEVLVNAYVPIILDADALNLIAQHPELTQYYTDNIIITPHPGEMARLTGKTISEIRENLIGTARDYASLYGVTCVLKDAVTVAVGREGQIYLNTSGNSGMAKGGSGDVLTGAIAGLLAQGEENWDGAVLGIYLHGLAGDRCLKHMGAQGILAHDLAEALGTIEKNRMEAES